MLEAIVRERLQRLQQLSIDQVGDLPNFSAEKVVVDGKEATVGVWHDVLASGRHRVVVQGIRERWGGIAAKVVANGFEVTGDGHARPLQPEELYDFT